MPHLYTYETLINLKPSRMVSQDDSVWAKLLALANNVPTSTVSDPGKKKELTRETDLVSDMGLVGDDAFQFMELYAETFGVERGDFDFSDYFESEGLWILPVFKKRKQRKRITLGMLEIAAMDGSWDSERLHEIQSRRSGDAER